MLTLPGEDWHDLPLAIRTKRLGEYQRLVYRAQGFRLVRRRRVDPETGEARTINIIERDDSPR